MSTWAYISGIIHVDIQHSDTLMERIKHQNLINENASIEMLLPFKAMLEEALKKAPVIYGSEGNAEFNIVKEASTANFCFGESSICPINHIHLYVSGSLRDTNIENATNEFLDWLIYMKGAFYKSFDIYVEYLCIDDGDEAAIVIHKDKIISTKMRLLDEMIAKFLEVEK